MKLYIKKFYTSRQNEVYGDSKKSQFCYLLIAYIFYLNHYMYKNNIDI